MIKRHTIASKTIIEALKSSKHPVSVADILKSLSKKGVTPNRATVYRLLKKYVQNHMVNQITSKRGATHYEYVSGIPQHHFLCNQCDTIYTFAAEVSAGESSHVDWFSNKNFKVTSHQFHGVCEPCLTK